MSAGGSNTGASNTGTGASNEPSQLRRVLGPVRLWAIAVGLVISGDYFGWNYGLKVAGPVGMGLATLLVTLLYLCFIFTYTELSSAIPNAGGPFVFAERALGRVPSALVASATLIELLFAPPAIARAIGSYVHYRVPSLGVTSVALGAFAIFGILNAVGVAIAATFELVVTALAAFELFLFFFLTAPHVEMARIVTDPVLPFGYAGVFAAIPFAIWFYLGMEGVAMSAEEVKNPPRDIPRGYLAGIATLVTLALGTLVCTTGVMNWQELYQDDSPLPRALATVLSADHPLTHMMVYLGLFGLVASFHGLLMGASRQVFALGRANMLWSPLGRLHPRLGAPTAAVVTTVLVGVGLLLAFGESTDRLITWSVFGAVTVYIISLLAVLGLRSREPTLERPFRTPLYPWPCWLALALAVFCAVALVASNPLDAALYVGIVGVVATALSARASKIRLS